ncbi:TIR domain-containing protein [Frankia sp. CiP3]|uniref:TIR domain-containing protein n=1 Tax=Frankia sp. CiP3 TaxID=2880971 RepID=UPI001EF71D88|nr:TIR domain-containing protein [Frankia sp. CiP3]
MTDLLDRQPSTRWDFFISYAQPDLAWAEWVAWQLEEAGYTVLFQHWDFVAGTRRTAGIHAGTMGARRTIAILSSAYLSSVHEAVEWPVAMNADRAGLARKLVPIRVEDCDPPGLFGEVTSVDLVGLPAEVAAARLLQGVGAAVAGRAKPARAPGYPGPGTAPGPDAGDPEPRRRLTPLFPDTRPGGHSQAESADLRTAVTGYWHPDRRSGPSAVPLGVLTDQLAATVRNQWLAEAELRRLNDPYTLPVRWTTMGEGVPRLATAGHNHQIGDFFRALPGRRLAILGAPGSGKTVLAAHLLLDLIAARDPGDPVPVLFTAVSWDPVSERFRGWLTAQLTLTYPGLAAITVSLLGARVSRAEALIDADLLVPIIDGIDELPEPARSRAFERLNQGLRPGAPLALTCRYDEYAGTDPSSGTDEEAAGDAAAASVGQWANRLNAAVAVRIEPLSARVVGDYLRATAGGPQEAGRWDQVVDTVLTSPRAPLTEALTTPLAVALARTLHAPSRVRPGQARADPAQLCDRELFPTAQSVLDHLFDGYIAAVYPQRRGEPGPDGSPSRWNAVDATRFHVTLAGVLRGLGTADIAWWRIPEAAPAVLPRLALGIAFTAVVTAIARLAAVPSLLSAGVAAATGLTVGALSFALRGHTHPRQAVLRPPTAREAAGGLAAGLVAAPTAGLAAHAASAHGGLALGCVAGVVGGVGLALAAGADDASDLEAAVSPGAVLSRDRASWIVMGVGLLSGVVLITCAGVVTGAGLRAGLAGGLAAGVVICLAVWLTQQLGMSFGRFAAASLWLACRRQLPFRLMTFLRDAHRRGVLRQVGAVYQYRHAGLQERLVQQRRPASRHGG